MKNVEGKVAFITGGASGIGYGMAQAFLDAGMKVVVADLLQQHLDEVASRHPGANNLHLIRVDVTDRPGMERAAAETERVFGKVHVLCNNAGVAARGNIDEHSYEDWDYVMGVCVGGTINGLVNFLPRMKAHGEGGHIVNTASMSGLATLPTLGGYGVTKYGVMALSEALAQELELDGAKVGVSVLCPGPVRSNIKASSRNRPAGLGQGGLADVDLEDDPVHSQMQWLEPEDAGDVVVRAVKRGDFYALTHPDMSDRVEARFAAISEAFRVAAAD